jgi:hypothetical protein
VLKTRIFPRENFSSCDKWENLGDSRIAKPDLANSTRFQVQIKERYTQFQVQSKERLTLFNLHLESRAVRKIRLRYTRIPYILPLITRAKSFDPRARGAREYSRIREPKSMNNTGRRYHHRTSSFA